MSTAICTAPPLKNEVTVMHHGTKRNHSPSELKEIVQKVHALRRVTKVTGFFTSNSIVELLRDLSTEDLITIGEELQLKPREMRRSASEVRK